MTIELLKAYKTWPVGHVFTDMPPNVARELTRRGIGRDVDAPPENRMMGGRKRIARKGKDQDA